MRIMLGLLPATAGACAAASTADSQRLPAIRSAKAAKSSRDDLRAFIYRSSSRGKTRFWAKLTTQFASSQATFGPRQLCHLICVFAPGGLPIYLPDRFLGDLLSNVDSKSSAAAGAFTLPA